MKLAELIHAYTSGALTKADFIQRANLQHSRLYEYPELLANSEVSEIRIDASGVAFYIGSVDLWLRCPPGESRVAPIEILNFRTYEPEETRVMMSLLDRDMVVFDIGANIGWFSLLFARQAQIKRIYAFEPLPYFNNFLKANVENNGLEQAISVNAVGFSNEQRSVEIFMEKGNATNASMRNVAGSEQAAAVTIEVVELDRWCNAQSVQPDFIKCDVEGAELLVMQGAERVLREARPMVFLEMLRKWSKPYGYHPNDLIEFLSQQGYACMAIGERQISEMHKVDEDTRETNYVFLHRGAHVAQLERLAGMRP